MKNIPQEHSFSIKSPVHHAVSFEVTITDKDTYTMWLAERDILFISSPQKYIYQVSETLASEIFRSCYNARYFHGYRPMIYLKGWERHYDSQIYKDGYYETRRGYQAYFCDYENYYRSCFYNVRRGCFEHYCG